MKSTEMLPLMQLGEEIKRRDQDGGGENLHLLGLISLEIGDLKSAISWLRRARFSNPDDAVLASDLSCALLESSTHKDDLAGMLESLDLLAGLREAGESTPNVCFNLSLALQELNLREEAAKLWQECFPRLCGDWLVEAKARKSAVLEAFREWDAAHRRLYSEGKPPSKELLRQLVQLNRERFYRLLLDLVFSESAKRPEWVEKAAEALFEVNGERLPLELARLKRRGLGASPGFEDFQRGFRLFHEHRRNDALRRFESVEVEKGHVLHPLGRYYRALSRFLADPRTVAVQDFEGVISAAERRGFRMLEIEALSLRALLSLGSRNSDYLSFKRKALEHVKGAGYEAQLAKLHNDLGVHLRRYGNRAGAFAHFRQSLRFASDVADNRILSTVYGMMADSSMEEGWPEAALYFQREAMWRAKRWGAPSEICRNAQLTIRQLVAQGHGRQALEALGEIQPVARSIPDSATRDWVVDDLRYLEAAARALSSAKAGLPAIDAAIELAKHRGFRADRFQFYAAKAELLANSASALESVAFVRSALEEAGEVIQTTPQARRDGRFIKAVNQAADSAVQLALDELRKPELALEFSERASRLSTRQPIRIQKLGLASERLSNLLGEHLSTQSTILKFHLLPGKLILWALSKNHVEVFEIQTERIALVERIRFLHESVAAEPDLFEEQVRSLWDLLLRPAGALIKSSERLVIVPDRALWSVPFAALKDREGHYLVQRAAVLVSPSLAAGLELEWGGSPPTGDLSLLCVGASGGPDSLRGPLLPQAEREAQEIFRLYSGNGTLLTGSEAGKDSILEALESSHVFHFAGHALVSGEPRLLLPARIGADAVVRSEDIEALRGGFLRWAVLAGCQTGRPTFSEYGPARLAEAFWGIGASSVTATLWPVGDEASLTLSRLLHEHFIRHRQPVEALRFAQMRMLQRGVASPVWSAYVVMGRSERRQNGEVVRQ